MRVLHRWTVPKYEVDAHLNEDAMACSAHRGTFAISDGASESFASARWARLLVEKFLRRPHVDARWIADAVLAYSRGFDRPSMSWSAQAAFDRGSFATLLGLRIEGGSAAILAIGDSLAVLDDGEAIRATFPYETVEQFRANPLLVSTIAARNEGLLSDGQVTRWELGGIGASTIYCMTDAVGAWLLEAPGERMPRLRALTSLGSFTGLVEGAREEKSMRRDDSTLLVLGY